MIILDYWKKRFSKNVLNNLSCIFRGVIVQNIYKSFIKKNGKKIKIISSGHPKIDIIKNTIKKFYNIEANLIKKIRKFILIATQFPRYNNNIIDVENNSDYFKKLSREERCI